MWKYKNIADSEVISKRKSVEFENPSACDWDYFFFSFLVLQNNFGAHPPSNLDHLVLLTSTYQSRIL